MAPTSGFNPKLSLSESPLTLLRNSSKPGAWAPVQNAMVREYRRRCNTVENIHKVIGS